MRNIIYLHLIIKRGLKERNDKLCYENKFCLKKNMNISLRYAIISTLKNTYKIKMPWSTLLKCKNKAKRAYKS